MRKIILLSLMISTTVFSQTKTQIDSLNALPYDKKVNQARSIGKLYLSNAVAANKMGYRKGEADSYANAALMSYYSGKFEKGVEYRQKAIGIYESIDDREMMAHEYGELGFSMKRRDMKRAQYYMRKAMTIAEEGKFKTRLGSIYDNYGVLKEMQNQLDSALLFYNKSLTIKNALQDSIGIPYSLSNIAGIYAMREEYAKAMPYYDKAMAIRLKRNDKIGLTELHGNMAYMYMQKGEDEKSIRYYEKGIDYAHQAGYLHMAVMFYNDLAKVYERNGQIQKALETVKIQGVYKDSILNKETNAKVAELEVEFESERKEKLLIQQKAEIDQRNLLLAGVSAVALLIGLLGWLIYRQQRLKNRQMAQEHELKSAIVQIENQNKLQDQRLAISRDLHDNIGSQLTFIISSVENIRYGFGIENTKLESKLDNISSFARETIVELRDTIWAMNHSAISVEDLHGRMLNFIEKARESKPEVKLDVEVDPRLSEVKLTSVEGMNLYRILQEAVNNALKYSQAKAILISISKSDSNLAVVISDDGLGFDPAKINLGNGLRNMQKRTEEIGGTFQLKSGRQGTEISIVKPLKQGA